MAAQDMNRHDDLRPTRADASRPADATRGSDIAALEAEYADLHQPLGEALAVAAPADLGERVYRASVPELPHNPVAAKLGWANWSGWKWAAAVGLVFFLSALYLRPKVETTLGLDEQVAIAEQAIQAPDHELDQRIDALEAEVAALSGRWSQGDGVWTPEVSDPTLARDLWQFEQALDTAIN